MVISIFVNHVNGNSQMMQTLHKLCAGSLIVLCLLLLSSVASSEEPVKEPNATTHFYFAQITDTHFGDRDSERRTKAAVDGINRLPLKIECVVHTGDITSERLEDESIVKKSLAILGGLDAPIHYIPGNHDILRKKHDTTMKIYTKNYGKLIYREEYHGVVFLFVYTEPLAHAFSISGFHTLLELEAQLKLAKEKPVIVCHHSPSVADFYRNRMHPGWKKEIREQWIALLNRYNVKAVLAGHFHRDEHHWLGDVPLYVSSSISGYWGRQASYRIYEYKDGKIGYRTQYIP